MRKLTISKDTRFNRLIVLKEIEERILPSGQKRRQFKCKCDCGKVVKADLGNLRSGSVGSCGCYQIDRVKITNTKHGYSKHPLYNVLHHMKQRCYDKNVEHYQNYGGRGIKICKEWLCPINGLNNFIAWNLTLPVEKQWQKGLDIDRQNNNKGYSPGNCRWVTRTVNSLNKRTNIYIKVNGKMTLFFDFWKRHSLENVSYICACQRLKQNIDPMLAVTKE